MNQLETVLAAIDAANAQDPNLSEGAPAEFLYGRRMSEILTLFAPGSGDELKIAVRGQHIERWKMPRAEYPEGKLGYLRWRADQKEKHASKVQALMAEAGYSEGEQARAGALVRKEKFKTDAEAQTLEDVACLVFLQHYAADFIAKHADDKVDDIIRKSWKKMSITGQGAALKLDLNPAVLAAAKRALA